MTLIDLSNSRRSMRNRILPSKLSARPLIEAGHPLRESIPAAQQFTAKGDLNDDIR